MPTDGWWKHHRSLDLHPLFEGEVSCRKAAFSDLIGMAEYEPTTRGVRGRLVQLERGELLASVRFLAERWRWSIGKVQRFMGRLEAENMVISVCSKTDTPTDTPSGTVYRVVNYDIYQDDRYTERYTDRYADDTQAIQIEEVKKKRSSRARASRRCPDDFEPNDAHRSIAEERGIDFELEYAKFRDHEFAKARSDWSATFRNWLRNARPDHPHGGNGKTSSEKQNVLIWDEATMGEFK